MDLIKGFKCQDKAIIFFSQTAPLPKNKQNKYYKNKQINKAEFQFFECHKVNASQVIMEFVQKYDFYKAPECPCLGMQNVKVSGVNV